MTSDEAGRPPLGEGFHQQVLDHLPTPVVVVDGTGTFRYGNRAFVDLVGWSADELRDANIADHVHPADVSWVMESFIDLTNWPEEQALDTGRWPPLRLRLLAKDGSIIPIEATGGGGLFDPEIQGVMYTARPAWTDVLLEEVFAGVASGDSLETLMRPIVDLVTLPPIPLEAAIYEQRADGTARCLVASHPALAELPATVNDPVPWVGLHTEATRLPVDELGDELAARLSSAGFTDCIHAGAHAPDLSTTLRLIAVTTEHSQSQAPVQRVARCRELLLVVQVKGHNDRMLAEAASLDELTGLPNRLGLIRGFEQIRSGLDDGAMLFVDLDDFKRINDIHGHAVGDRVLTTVAERLRHVVRADDVVARLGGDEFAVLLVDQIDRLETDAVERLARRIVRVTGQPIAIGDIRETVTASVGVARVEHGQGIDRVLERADEAMYGAKRSGGDRFQLADATP